jgi:hypothetical protein
MIELQAEQDYEGINRFVQDWGLELFCVEAEAPVIESQAHLLPQHTHRIKNFRAWCCDRADCLVSQWGCVLHLIRDGFFEQPTQITRELSDELVHAAHIDTTVKQNPSVFPDGGHCGDREYKKLWKYIRSRRGQ